MTRLCRRRPPARSSRVAGQKQAPGKMRRCSAATRSSDVLRSSCPFRMRRGRVTQGDGNVADQSCGSTQRRQTDRPWKPLRGRRRPIVAAPVPAFPAHQSQRAPLPGSTPIPPASVLAIELREKQPRRRDRCRRGAVAPQPWPRPWSSSQRAAVDIGARYIREAIPVYVEPDVMPG